MTAEKKIEDTDHAFELALILTSIISGVLAQYVPTEAEINLPPIIANMRRLSIVFFFPLILTVIVWILTYFIDSESWKMHLRSYAWGSIIFSAINGVIEFYAITHVGTFPEWVDFIFIAGPVIFGLLFPIIPILLVSRILRRYKRYYGAIDFFSYEKRYRRFGRVLGKLVRYSSFLLSYAVFWLAFLWAIAV